LATANVPSALLGLPIPPEWPAFLSEFTPGNLRNRKLETFTRMIFSALVDADYLDTEEFMEVARSDTRSSWEPLSEYIGPLEEFIGELSGRTSKGRVNSVRAAVLEWCRKASASPQGVFTLTVPTGGGKTLSGLSFALRHARRHSLSRVIMALPFISIIDQTADTLRRVFDPTFGTRAFVEHHSAIRPVHDTTLNRLASENWDSPLIVTTQVQLFESMFSNRPGAARKLHNLAKSVIILDEVQSLPMGLLDPLLDQLRELAMNYGTSILLMTATQPALHKRRLGTLDFPGFDPAPTEIVPQNEMAGLFKSLDRTETRWPVGKTPTTWNALATEIVAEPQVLAVVHRRDDARILWQEVSSTSGEPPFHLSALMCPAHRQRVLDEIRGRLHSGDTCRVVSTQLIEAGVDVDFPVVYRAMAGLESLAQTAGRCNREGRLDKGSFRIFRAPTEPPRLLRNHRDVADVMHEGDPVLSLSDPEVFRSYFDRLYAQSSLDVRGVQPLREALKFRATAEAFTVIDDSSIPIVIPYRREGEGAVAAFRAAGPSRDRLRALQRFTVGVYPDQARIIEARGAIELLHDMVRVLVSTVDYDEDLGLRLEAEPFESWIA
jgi:CRISPR-associated endonuclease/helicase Cas3